MSQGDAKLTPDEDWEVMAFQNRMISGGMLWPEALALALAVFCCKTHWDGGFLRDYSRYAAMPKEMPIAKDS